MISVKLFFIFGKFCVTQKTNRVGKLKKFGKLFQVNRFMNNRIIDS